MKCFILRLVFSGMNVTLRPLGKVAPQDLGHWLPPVSSGMTSPHPTPPSRPAASAELPGAFLSPLERKAICCFLGFELNADKLYLPNYQDLGFFYCLVGLGFLFFACFSQSFLSSGGRLVSPGIVRGLKQKRKCIWARRCPWLPLRIVNP